MIPVCKPWLPGNEEKYVLDAIRTNWISSKGEYLDKFEEEFAKYCGTKYAVSCTSGLAALHLACVSLGLKKGDEVIVPTFTMAASVNAIIFTGATPVLVDSEIDTWNIDTTKIEEKITSKTKAIMPVHIYGHPCDMSMIYQIAKKHNLFIIEDAAEATGAEYIGKKAGSLSDIGCFSFYANKIITTGEGGMCVTDNKELAEKMRKLRNHAFDLPRFVHSEVGYNYRLTNIQAAIGFAQMENAQMLIEARRSVGLRYNKLLKNTPGLILPVEKPYAKNVYWMYGIVLDNSIKLTKEQVMDRLKERGIETRGFFIPMHKQPAYYNKTVENAPDCSGNFPVADMLGERGFYLPSSSDLNDNEIEYICSVLKEIIKDSPFL
ncbi:MAG: DegT/DnrJ/EryC1/StrS family aminotransferase [Nanoarchaeota archaeon]|nr:DegT/DnrJ/EryC1/StrS family aminotransferase [Nanoarchaeota archaeon]